MKIKILQINKLYSPWLGGVETHVQDLCEQLVHHTDIELKVLVCHEKDVYEDTMINDVPVKKLPNLVYKLTHKTLFLSSPFSITYPYWLKKMKADILHFHLPNPLAIIAYFLVRPRGHVVVTWHSDIIKQKKFMFFFHPLLVWFLKKTKAICTTSPNIIHHSPYLRRFRDQCYVVPLGINPKDYTLSDSESTKISHKIASRIRPQLLFVGRLVSYKGVKYLIDAMQHIEADLIIVGNGILREQCLQQISEKQLDNKITIMPPLSRPELINRFHLCNIFVLPSITSAEAFGIVQLEAMLCGKPVVSTNLPTGVPFVNLNEQTGLIVEPKNSIALGNAINRLVSDPQLAKRLGEFAKHRVLREFTNEKMAERVITIYQEIFGRTNSKNP